MWPAWSSIRNASDAAGESVASLNWSNRLPHGEFWSPLDA
jgi:hypothetical protein